MYRDAGVEQLIMPMFARNTDELQRRLDALVDSTQS
jgi:hypothetical protein